MKWEKREGEEFKTKKQCEKAEREGFRSLKQGEWEGEGFRTIQQAECEEKRRRFLRR